MPSTPTELQILKAYLELFEPEIRDAFLSVIQDVVDNALFGRLTQNIKDGRIRNAFHTLGFTPAAMRPLTASIERAFEQGGVLKGDTFPKYINTSDGRAVFRFDVRNSRAEAWLRDKSSRLISELTEEARINTQSVIQRGVIDGRNPRSVALDLVGRIDRQTGQRTGGVIGLTQRQEGWVANVRRDLENLDKRYFTRELRDKRFDSLVRKAIESGKPLSSADVERLTGRYKTAALRYRAETISRTEVNRALNQSDREATMQAVDLGAVRLQDVEREWDTSGRSNVRDTHRAMDGQKRGLDEPFESPSGARLMQPGDTSLGAPVEEVANCVCRVKTTIDFLAQVE